MWVSHPLSVPDNIAAVTMGDVARSGAGGVGIDRYPGVDVVTVSGDLDVDHSRAVQDVVADATQVAQTEVVLDLTAVEFMDSTGVGALLYCRRTLASRAANLSLVCSGDGPVLQLLRVAELDRDQPIYPTTVAALEALVVGE